MAISSVACSKVARDPKLVAVSHVLLTDSMIKTLSNETLAEMQEYVCVGKTDTIVGKREQLRLALRSKEIQGSERLLGAILGSALHLVCLDKSGAAECLRPYIDYSARTGVQTRKDLIDKVCDEAPSLLAGLILSEIANLMYRTWQAAEGNGLAQRALEILRKQARPLDIALSADFIVLMRCLAVCWSARLAWQHQREAEALKHLDGLRVELNHLRARAGEDRARGVDLVTAITLDLSADLHNLRGETSLALENAFEAWLLLGCGNAEDSVRAGHVLYTLGKILIGQTASERYYFPVLVFAESERRYPLNHPLILRAINRKARALLLGGRDKEARQCLAEGRIRSRNIKGAADERGYCDAEFCLTEVLLAEHDAALRPEQRELGRLCLSQSETLLGKVLRIRSRRLQAEAHLHHGLAHIRLGDSPTGRKHLDEAEKLIGTATWHSSRRIGVWLARAEAAMKDDTEAARKLVKDAQTNLYASPNTFLSEWCQRLAVRLELPVVVTIDPTTRYREAKNLSELSYISYQLKRHNYDYDRTAETIGVERPSLYKIAHRLRILPEPKGQRRQKQQ